jgi:dUTP pyrophosphatase
VSEQPVKIKLRRLPHGAGQPLPAYQSALASGLDLYAAISDTIKLEAGQWRAVETGIALEMPAGLEAQIRPRSGLAARFGVTVLNSPGTIDADYRGELKAILINHGRQGFEIEPGMRIAQLVFQKIVRADLTDVAQLEDSERGSGGFGSSGGMG